MSGESELHEQLVQALSSHVRVYHGGAGNLAIFIDDRGAETDRPQRINGHLPDVAAQDVPQSFIVIGEAKTPLDLESSRTRQQLRMFLDYLALFEKSFFYLGVPLRSKPRARAILQQIIGQQHAPVQAQVVCFEGIY